MWLQTQGIQNEHLDPLQTFQLARRSVTSVQYATSPNAKAEHR